VFFNNKQYEIYPFCSPIGRQLRERKSLEMFKRVAEDAGITMHAFLHIFKHTYATLLIQRGTPIESIRELLSHWSVVQTEAYAHNKTEHLLPQASRLNKLLGDN
jgi:integrase/recombinase XerD